MFIKNGDGKIISVDQDQTEEELRKKNAEKLSSVKESDKTTDDSDKDAKDKS